MPNIYGNSEIWGDLLVTGSFSILGSASTISSTNLVVSDAIISLGHSQSGSPVLDEGIMFGRGTGLTQAFIWDETNDTFALIGTNDDHTVVGSVNINSYSNLRVGGLTTSTFKMSNGSSTGYIMTSDSSGNAIWTGATVASANFANTDLTLNNQRTHELNGYDLVIQQGSSQVFAMYNGSYNQLVTGNSIFEIASNYQEFYVAGTASLIMTTGSVIFNNSSKDYDFRIKGDTNSDLFFVDASTDSIGVGTPTPSYRLHVIGTVSSTGFRMTNGSTNGYFLKSNANGDASWSQITASDVSGLSGGLTGSGTLNYVSKWSSTGGLTNSLIYDNGSTIGIGVTNSFSSTILQVNSSAAFVSKTIGLSIVMNTSSGNPYGIQSVVNVSATSSYGTYNDVSNATNNYANYNVLTGTGTKYGIYNQINAVNDSSNKYGLYNYISGSNVGNYGVYNYIVGTYGTKYGSYTFMNDSGTPATTTNYGHAVVIFSGLNNFGYVASISPGSGGTNYGSHYTLSATGSNYGSYISTNGAATTNYGIYIDSYSASTNYGVLVNRGTSVFNDFGDPNTDFRIEGDTNANLFFVDASADNIGIGTNTPSYRLQVSGTVSTTGFRMTNGASANYLLQSDSSGNATWVSATLSSANFANTDLTFTGTRTHNTNGNSLIINGDSLGVTGFLAINSALSRIGYDNNRVTCDVVGIETTHLGLPRITVNSTETVINEGGNNFDFRIEGDTNSNLFFIDASTDNIGVGTNTPLYRLQVSGTVSTTGFMMTDGATNGYFLKSNASGVASWSQLTTSDISGLSGGLTGSGTTNYIPRWTSSSVLSSTGSIYDDGTNIGIGTTSPVARLDVRGSVVFNNSAGSNNFQVKGTLDSNLISTNASANVAGVGGNSNNVKFTIANTSTTHATALYVQNTNGTASGTNFGAQIYNTTSTTGHNYGLYVSVDNGTSANYGVVVYSGTSIFNDIGGNYDFIVKGDTDNNLLSVNASRNNVGIGTSVGFLDANIGTKLYITNNGATNSTNQGLVILTGNGSGNYGASIGIGTTIASNLGDIGVASSITNTIASTSYTYYGNNSGTASTAYGLYQNVDSTGTTNYGLYIVSDGATNNYGIVVNKGTNIFNDGSDIDSDFRIESNGKTHMFFVDSSADSIGINNPAPDAYLHIGAGSTTIAPFKLTTGNLVTTAEAGALEYNNPLLYFTNGDNRAKIPLVLSSYTTTTSSAQFDTTLTDITGLTLSLVGSRKYEIDIHMPLAFASTGGGKIKLNYTGTLTLVTGYSMTLDETTDSIFHVNRYKDTDTAFDGTEYNSTADLEGVFVFRGWLDVDTPGVLSVRFAQSASTTNTAYVMPGSWIKATVIS